MPAPKQNPPEPVDEPQDPSHKTLNEALLAFQRDEVPKLALGRNAEGYNYRYLTLDKLMDGVQPALSRHGLIWATMPCLTHASGENKTGGMVTVVKAEPGLRYQLTHVSSGEQLEETMPLMLKQGSPQDQGSAITYARRYALLAVLGLAPDDDDDGAAATETARTDWMTPEQVERMDTAIAEAGLSRDDVLQAVGLQGRDRFTAADGRKVKQMIARHGES